MENGETATTSPLDMFTSNMEALGIPPGACRLDAFLRLPSQTQAAIIEEFLGPAPSESVEPAVAGSKAPRDTNDAESSAPRAS
jgi:hypothetical protein